MSEHDQLSEDVKALREAGFRAIAHQYREMAKALRVIHTWASYRDGELVVPEDVTRLCDKVLRRFR